MFDLFRKEELNALKEKVARLEEENRSLLLRLEKRDEKTKKTVATKQEVDQELNEARQRIFSLENEVQRLKKETPQELNFRFSENLPKKRLEDILFLFDSMQSRTSTLVTVYLAKDGVFQNISPDILDLIESQDRYLIEKIESSTGKAVFYDTERTVRLVIIPVFPVLHTEYSLDRRFNTEPLKKSMTSEKVLVINAHAGETFTGVIETGAFIEHDVIRSSVMGKHSKGGWSQKRFQSLVEEDVKHHADKVREALSPMVERNKDIQYIIAGGEGRLVKMVLEGLDYPLVMKSMEPVERKSAEQVLREIMMGRMYGI